MPKIKSIIKRLLPKGTSRTGDKVSWKTAPFWPPDAFAVAATLVDWSGCYTDPASFSGDGVALYFSSPEGEPAGYIQYVGKTAKDWRTAVGGHAPKEINRLWAILLTRKNAEVCAPRFQAEDWCRAALLLMMIADEACAGVGFVRNPDESLTNEDLDLPISDFYLEQHYRVLMKEPTVLPDPQKSLYFLVPPTEACVQPKANTAQVGCTIRSFTHHLALLPAVGEVDTKWLFGLHKNENRLASLNILVVPFPFRICGTSFRPGSDCPGCDDRDNKSRFFELDLDWLGPPDPKKRADFAREFGDFLLRLIAKAKQEVDSVHAIILPELALNEACAAVVAQRLADQKDPGLEFFISGALFQKPNPKEAPRNGIYGCSFTPLKPDDPETPWKPYSWQQNKHHRWKLERGQIGRYHLGASLDPDCDWWEWIDVSRRECYFRVFRYGTCLAALICEDLARIDPVQTVIRAIGPNLVVALLMDGAFHGQRWSYRYATVLADDPGSSVLAVTSLGLIRRSFSYQSGAKQSREVAMWRDPKGSAKFLELPANHHALLLTLSSEREAKCTLDGRSDRNRITNLGMTIVLSLSGAHALRDDDPNRPDWVKLDS